MTSVKERRVRALLRVANRYPLRPRPGGADRAGAVGFLMNRARKVFVDEAVVGMRSYRQ